MINSMRLLTLSVFVLNFLGAQSQEGKYQKKNAQDSVILYYSTVNCNSRSLIVKENVLYAANSNGALYAYDLSTGKSTNLMENKKF
jgi:outer membrane protein assembly factor BamB